MIKNYTYYEILVKPGLKRRLAKKFNTTEQTVRSALRCLTDGEIPDKIRKQALKWGGRLGERYIDLSIDEEE